MESNMHTCAATTCSMVGVLASGKDYGTWSSALINWPSFETQTRLNRPEITNKVSALSLGPRPKPIPAWVASSITHGEEVIMEAIHTGVGSGLGPLEPRLECSLLENGW